MRRRSFLHTMLSSTSLVGLGSAHAQPSTVASGNPPAGSGNLPAGSGNPPAGSGNPPAGSGNKLVVVMLRGAVDGLSVVAPFSEPSYREARSTLALAAPGSADDALLPLDRQFGLHPSLARLHGFWLRGQLGFVHASGSPDPTRSHFDAQDYLETGTPGRKSTPDGWMNRLLAQMQGPSGSTRAVNMGATPARILAGSATVASLGLGARAFDAKAVDDPRMRRALARLYGDAGALGRTFQETTESRSAMNLSMAAASERSRASGEGMDNGRSSDPSADNGAPTARGFAADARRLGQLLQADPNLQLAFSSVGGWDTHVNQGGARGQLANRLASLAEGLESLVQGLDAAYSRTVIVLMSEFGRTVRQNGTGGTDHGRGNVMCLLGGPVAGGRVLGVWPGLDQSALVEGRDLDVTTDFRAVLAPVLQQHLGVDDAALARIFPDFTGATFPFDLVRA